MSKAEFTSTLNAIMERFERLAAKEDDYLKTCRDGKKLYELFTKMKEDKYYQRQFGECNERKKREILTDAQKLKDKRFCVCKKCNRIVLKTGLTSHMKTKICYDIKISKEVSHKHKDKRYKAYKKIIIATEVHHMNVIKGEIAFGMREYYM